MSDVEAASTHDEARRAELGAHVLHVRADRTVSEAEYAEPLGLPRVPPGPRERRGPHQAPEGL